MADDSILWLESCQSTNDEAAKYVSSRDYLTVVAGQQSKGRGRMGRTWHSPPGSGLYLSHIVFPRFSHKICGVIPLLAGVAVAETCESLGVSVQLKWPNDIFIGSRKLAGILCETQGQPSQWNAIIGIGLNLKTPESGWPGDLPAIALDSIYEGELSKRWIARHLVRRIENRMIELELHGTEPLFESWYERAFALDTPIRRGNLEGTFAGLTPRGALMIRTTGGTETIEAGDIEVVAGK